LALLDDLKREAERIRREGIDTRSEEEKQRAFYDEHTGPCLQRVRAYLHELYDQLQVVRPKIEASYRLPGVGAVHTLSDGYAVKVDSAVRPTRVGFECIATAVDGRQRPSLPEGDTADDLRALLNRLSVPFGEWPVRGVAGAVSAIRFEFTLKVPVGVYFVADLPGRAVQMVASNMEDLRAVRQRLEPAKVDADWLDRLGHYLLRSGPDPNALDLSEEAREEIRRRVEAARLQEQRELELARRLARLEEAEEARRAAGNGAVLDGLLHGLRRRLRKDD